MNPMLSSQYTFDGEIQLIYGPMFSGKTTELLRRIRRYTIANYKCCVIKYSKDNRYSKDAAATHDKQTWQATSLSELSQFDSTGVDVIGIDEGQFFPDLPAFCEEKANQGKIVIVAALDGTFQMKPFGNVLDLIPIAESVVKLNAVCMLCHRTASFTRRLGTETKVELIGGSDMYVSTCRRCHSRDTTKDTCIVPSKKRVYAEFLNSSPGSPCSASMP
mmetsp:Transcript_28300/g.43856  ORF Transcript_28300/g.43856 Transcript_28300/m.43856 type:complete len:218 (-) Transcript_28300:116-769(-)|eukprot:CAMPEP_0201511222 /NCGR_PEP_ID=MMETSP0161_2-20130828/3705_1 /ASSEMBLY_ACC=CAM_ASM_000251 /TAXON_ID=180227 /ORGANISM="Neoparamoeba aestuarina, Strain SoJaBio B1-5/56/2" /LENGTH=217 /DNA_ID=CAMNT_0047906621 /DNA_START=15 /DNA_END=668 /DNA_ORIENTATION=-